MYTISFTNNRLSPEDADELARYVAIIPAMPLLTPAQESTADHDTLVERNMRLSALVAVKYSGRGVPISDLIQEGNIGLIRAAATFDPARGRFSTYAIKSIREYILRAVHNHGNTIRKPVWAQDGSKHPGIRPETRAMVEAREVVSGDEKITSGHGSATDNKTLFDRIPSEVNTESDAIARLSAAESRAAVALMLATLPEIERRVVELYIVQAKPLREVAAEIGRSHETIRAIVKRAKQRMREACPEAIHAL